MITLLVTCPTIIIFWKFSKRDILYFEIKIFQNYYWLYLYSRTLDKGDGNWSTIYCQKLEEGKVFPKNMRD